MDNPPPPVSAARTDPHPPKPTSDPPASSFTAHYPYNNASVPQSLFPSTASPPFTAKPQSQSAPPGPLQPQLQSHAPGPPRPAAPTQASFATSVPTTNLAAASRPPPSFPHHGFSNSGRPAAASFAPPPLPPASRVADSALPQRSLPPPASSSAQYTTQRSSTEQQRTPTFGVPRTTSSEQEPFPNSKTLPFPISHHPPAASAPMPSASRPPQQPQQYGQQQQQQHRQVPPQQPQQQTNTTSTQNYVMYDIAKLHAAHCTIIGGKVYNDKGHNICGVLNQHDKPCKRIGKCPFHGVATPVSPENSCNGVVDSSGTAITIPSSPEGTLSPQVSATLQGSDGAPAAGTTATSLNSSRPRAPPKKMQYKHGWTKEEHFLFLRGLEMHDRGSWKQIASVVQSRTPTQVQSHAQKYFLRQKQKDKNKRSIHDLTMDSPEMRELEKRYRSGELKTVMPSIGLSDNLYMPPPGDGVSGKAREQTGSGVGQGMASPSQNMSFMQNDPLPQNVAGDTAMSRFAAPGNTLASRFGQGQAMSATTLGSSVSSGVQIPQFSNPNQVRGQLPGGAPFLHQQDILAHGTISTGQKRLDDGGSMRPRSDVPQSREVVMANARPAFPQDAYQSSAGHSLHTLSPKTGPFARPPDPGTLGPGAGHAQNDHAANQPQYPQTGFQSLYNPGSNGNAIFPNGQTRVSTEGQFSWPYDAELKHRRTRDMSTKDTIQLQNSLGGIGNIGMPESFSNMGGIPQEQQVDATAFDASASQQTPAFASGLFGGADAVVVGEAANTYGISASQHGNPGNVPVTVSINGMGAPSALPLGSLPVRGPGAISNTPFVRN